MGGRGAASGMSVDKKGKPKHPYGTEFKTVFQQGNIKFVVSNSGSAKAPMETMTQGRVYAVVNEQGNIKSIAYYDKHNKRHKQIDINGHEHFVNGKPEKQHTHLGYEHEEYGGTRLLTEKEQKMVERVLKTWYYHKGK